jgi:chemotaxis protein methyltransferase CheR
MKMIKITDVEFKLLAEFIKENSGIHLKNEKKTLLVSRLSHILSELNMENFMTYYKYLQDDQDGKKISGLIDKITTNHTYFMRESDHFSYFSESVLPFWEKNNNNKDLRIWCAASSTGEEPYTLAMILEDYFKKKHEKWDKKLLATDLSLNVLNQAEKGIYASDKIKSLPKTWTLNYFDKISSDSYQVKSSLRKEVVYRRFNLLEPTFPFKKKFHVIFCRNVMIYFDNETKEQLINKLYNHLEYGGYLFIGHSESINKEKSKLEYIKPSVYRKI